MIAKPPKPFLNIFAGPNGSGKSTLIEYAAEQKIALGVVINADRIVHRTKLRGSISDVTWPVEMFGAKAADAMRDQLIQQAIPMTIETVLSDAERWTNFFVEAKEAGFDLRFFFVTTSDPEINVARVLNRVALGGHGVPADKIRSRYEKVMRQSLPQVLPLMDTSEIFDNSDALGGAILVASKTFGKPLIATISNPPAWLVPLLGHQ